MHWAANTNIGIASLMFAALLSGFTHCAWVPMFHVNDFLRQALQAPVSFFWGQVHENLMSRLREGEPSTSPFYGKPQGREPIDMSAFGNEIEYAARCRRLHSSRLFASSETLVGVRSRNWLTSSNDEWQVPIHCVSRGWHVTRAASCLSLLSFLSFR